LLGGLSFQGSIDFAAEKFVVGVEFQRTLVCPDRKIVLTQFKENVSSCDRTIDFWDVAGVVALGAGCRPVWPVLLAGAAASDGATGAGEVADSEGGFCVLGAGFAAGWLATGWGAGVVEVSEGPLSSPIMVRT
jgi:hypothetical protein